MSILTPKTVHEVRIVGQKPRKSCARVAESDALQGWIKQRSAVAAIILLPFIHYKTSHP